MSDTKRRDIAMQAIFRERNRQVDSLGYTPENDDGYDECQLSRAAACYMLGYDPGEETDGEGIWPDELKKKAYGPPPTNDEEELKQLAKAGALVVAEYERVLRRMGR